MSSKLISIDETLVHELSVISKLLGVSQQEIIEEALELYFNHLELTIAEKISKEIKEGKMKLYKAENVFKGEIK
ncbi:MAG: ribbon-helix-helix domain-containing protein [Desulfurobacteriaceae bacterium]